MTERTAHRPTPFEAHLWPLPEPVPVEGCARCGELAALRARARAEGDLSGVSDCNVLLRRHQEGHR